MAETHRPAVGIFWMVGDELVAAGCDVDEAAPYGDCLTYDGGHSDHWDRWRAAGGRWLAAHSLPQSILTTEYDAHPRGRIVRAPEGFVIYADRRLQTARARFGLRSVDAIIRSDLHYR